MQTVGAFGCDKEDWNNTKDNDTMAWPYTIDVGGYWFANVITEIVYHCKWMTVKHYMTLMGLFVDQLLSDLTTNYSSKNLVPLKRPEPCLM